MNGQEIIDILKESRQTDYASQENWENLDDIGLTATYREKLGTVVVMSNTDNDDWNGRDIVWRFVDHDVYIKGTVTDGSYGVGYKLDTWDLKEVFPKKIEVTIYE